MVNIWPVKDQLLNKVKGREMADDQKWQALSYKIRQPFSDLDMLQSDQVKAFDWAQTPLAQSGQLFMIVKEER